MPASSKRRTKKVGGSAKKADGGLREKLVGDVVALREELDTLEATGNACVAEAEGRLAATNGRAADMLDNLSKHEAKEKERFAMWKHVTEDLQEMAARRQRGELKSLKGRPGDGWGGMTESLDAQMARFTSRVNAAGPSPSSVVSELRARDAADLEEEERRGPSKDMEQRKQKLIALEGRDDELHKRTGGSATTNSNTDISTDTIANADTNAHAHTNANADGNTNTHATANANTNTNTNTSERSVTATHTTPSVGDLRRERRYLRKRVKTYNETCQRLLAVIDGRQTAADEGIRRLEKTLGVCNARRIVFRDTIKGLVKEMGNASARARKVQLAQVASHTPPVNSISKQITNWKEGAFYKAFVEHARVVAAADTAAAAPAAGGGGEGDRKGKAVFIAKEFLSEEKELYAKRGSLGEGGFGRVDKVSAFTPPEYFALKSIKTDTAEGSAQKPSALKINRENILVEMAVHCRLPAHVNVTQALALTDCDYNKLEILSELALHDMSKPSWGLMSTSLCDLMGDLAGAAAGLVFLHEHGIGHNDIKPANILMFKGELPGSDLTAKLTDFGLALAFGDLRKGHGSLGITPPEAILEKYMPCRPDQDIFAMGHLILLIVSKTAYKSHNMFLSRAVRPKSYAEKQKKLDVAGMYRFMEKKTLRRMVSPYYRRKLFDPENISDELGDLKEEVLEMVDMMTSADPSRRPPTKTVATFATRIHQHLVENKASDGSLSALKADEDSAASAQFVPSTRSSQDRNTNAATADLPSVEALPAAETGGGSDADVGPASGPLVSVVRPAEPEVDIRRSDLKAAAGATAGSPDATIDGVSAAAGPTDADPEQSAPLARPALGSSNATTIDLPSGEILPGDETSGGSDSGSGSTGGPSVQVVAPAKPERDIRRSDLGTAAGETAASPDATIDDAPVPTAAGAASLPADVAAAASASSASAASASVFGSPTISSLTAADSEQSAPSARSILLIEGINTTNAELPSVDVSPAEKTGRGSIGGGGSTSGPSVPVVAPTNREGNVRMSEVGTVAGETTGLSEVITNDAAAPASAGSTAPAAVAVFVAATPRDTAPSVAVIPAASAAGATRSRNSDDGSGGVGVGSGGEGGGGGESGGGGGGEGGGIGGGGGGDGDGVVDSGCGGGSGGEGSVAGRAAGLIVTPVNRERESRQSELGPVAGETVRLPEAIVDGAAAPALAGASSRADAAVVASPTAPAASPVAATDATRSRKGGGGSGAGSCGSGGCGGGGGGGHSVADGAVGSTGAASLNNSPSAATSATVAHDNPVCVSGEEFVSSRERERQEPAPDLVRSRCVVPCRVSNDKAATDETGVPLCRVGYVPEVCSSRSCSSDGVAAGAPVQASQATRAVARRAGVIVPSAVDGGGAARQATCGWARRRARRADHDCKRRTGAEWLLHDVCKGGPAAFRQKTAGAGGDRGGDDVHDVTPSSVNAGDVQTTSKVSASPPPPRSHGMFNIAHVVKAAIARLAPPVRSDGGGASPPPSTPGPQAPPPSQAALGWSRWGVFSGRGGLASAEERAGQRVDGGYRASADRAAGVAATRAKARQLAGSWHAGIVRGPSYGGLAPHADAPFGVYGGRAASPQQWPFVACGARGYLP